MKGARPDLLTIIVPRHPDRGPFIARLLTNSNLKVALRSEGKLPDASTDIYIADTIGELGLFYNLVPVAFVGGSLVPHGGQNPMEAIKLGAAVVTGPHWRNFADAYEELLASGGCAQVSDANDLATAVLLLLEDAQARARMMARAEGAIAAHGRSAAAHHRRDRALPAATGDAAPCLLGRHSGGTAGEACSPRRCRRSARSMGAWRSGTIAGVAPYRSRLPVICIGNFTAGGGGKTPTAIAVAKVLKDAGERPCFLTRGYGGKTQGPVLVAKGQSAAEVGDETLLLAAHAPTVVAADRAAGARLIEGTDATVIVMDDGFQNPQLAKDFSLIVVDAATGLGNGLVMPAGPLRAPLDKQMPRADALLLIGDGGKTAPLAKSFEAANKPVLKARMAPRGDARWLGVLPVIGFAGIANPKKFYATLSQSGARLTGTRSFPDHHPYTERQAERLLRWAREWNAMLVTTEKDWVRLPDDDGTELSELKFRSRPLLIDIEFADGNRLKRLLVETIEKRRAG